MTILRWLNPLFWWRRYQQRRQWRSVYQLYVSCYRSGDFGAAQVAAVRSMELAAGIKELGWQLQGLMGLVNCQRAAGDLVGAIESAEQMVVWRQRLATAPDDRGLVEARELVGELCLLDEQVGRAIEVYGQALPGRRLLDGQRGGVELINILLVLADLFDRQGEKDRSEKLASEAELYQQRLLVRQDGAATLQLEMVMTQLQRRKQGEHLTELEQWENLMTEGSKLWEKGDIFAAITPHEKALAIARRIFPPIHSDLATSLNNLAALYKSQGKWEEAEPLYQEALKISRQLFGNSANNDLAVTLNNLALLYESQGKWEEAEPPYQEALKIRRQLFGNSANNDLAATLNNLAGLYESQGKWKEAEPLCQEALKIRRQLFGNSANNDLAATLNNLAGLYRSQGKWEEAEPLYQEVLKISRQLFGNSANNDLAATLNNLAGLYGSQGKREEAEPLYQEALKIRRQLFGNSANNDLAATLNNLAGLYESQGKWEEAEPLYQEALKIYRQLFGNSANKDLAMSLNNLASLHQLQGKREEAEPLCQEALKIYRQLFADRGHPDLVNSHRGYGLGLAQQHRYPEATQQFLAAAQIETLVLRDRFRGLTESDRLSYRDDKQSLINGLFSALCQYNPDTTTIYQAFEVWYLWKSIATADEIAISAAIARSDNPDLRQYQTQRHQTQKQLSQLNQNLTEEDRLQVKELNAQLQKLEKSLRRQIPQYQLLETTIDSQIISDLVPPGAVLIDFVRFDLYNFIQKQWQDPQYLAFTLHNHQIHLTPLGPANEIDQLITHYRTTASHIPNLQIEKAVSSTGAIPKDPNQILTSHHQTASQLYQTLIAPLNLPPTTNLIIAPEAALNLVPFGLLPQPNNQTLSDTYNITYITASRDLNKQRLPHFPAKTPAAIFANPNYNHPHPAPPAPSTSGIVTCGGGIAIADSSSPQLAPLHATEPLAHQIAKTFHTTPYLRDNATVTNLKAINVPQYLVIATHGLQGLAPDREPMLDTGLAFAGYNTDPASGLITARDLLEIDLWGNQLTILIACSSGTGTISQGEGIFGLKRALSIIGARTLIVSLWDVPVQATILLMEKFFALYQQQNIPAPQALQQAQHYIRDISRTELAQHDQGRIILAEIDSSHETTHLHNAPYPLQHPMFWGAWICQSS